MKHLILTMALGMAISSTFAQKFSNSAEIVDILNKSALSYNLGMLEKDAVATAHTKLNASGQYQVAGNKTPTIKKYTLGETGNEAKKLYNKGEYKAARQLYQKIGNENATAITRVGQCYQKEGDLNAAKGQFEQAIELNYHDWEAHWALANVFFKQKQYDKAMNAITTAHILNRNHKEIKQNLDKIYQAKSLKTGNWDFVPQIKIEKGEGKIVDVQFQMEWMNYALPFAIRKYEPGIQEKLQETTVEQKVNPAVEGLTAMYQAIMRDNELSRKAPYANIKRALEGSQLHSFSYYEAVLPENPEVALLLRKETIGEISDYLIKMRSVEIR